MDTLLIQLNRYNNQLQKVDVAVDLPELPGHRSYYKAETEKSTTFELMGCACHWGNLSNGHYWTYIRNGDGVKGIEWTLYDDATITQQPQFYMERGCAESAYLFW